MAYVCGDSYNPGLNNGLCNNSLTVVIPPGPTPGMFDLALVKWMPLNEFDQDGWVGHVGDISARLSVLRSILLRVCYAIPVTGIPHVTVYLIRCGHSVR
eukprot:1191849-Rhodomonas_salina.3